MNMRKSILTTIAALTITASTALTGAAQAAPIQDTSSITIGRGDFTVSLNAYNFHDLDYSLVDQTATDGKVELRVVDMTGDAKGWEVNVEFSDFEGRDRPLETPIRIVNFDLTNPQITLVDPNSQAISAANMPATYTSPTLNWKADPFFGEGGYLLTMDASLTVPGLTESQTYTSTGTVTIVTGP